MRRLRERLAAANERAEQLKHDLDALAAAVYLQKEDDFTYTAEFMVQEIRARSDARLQYMEEALTARRKLEAQKNVSAFLEERLKAQEPVIVELKERAERTERLHEERVAQYDELATKYEEALKGKRVAERNSSCDVCAGKGDPGTGKPCVCGGSGLAIDAATGFRIEIREQIKARDRAERERDEAHAQLRACAEALRRFLDTHDEDCITKSHPGRSCDCRSEAPDQEIIAEALAAIPAELREP